MAEKLISYAIPCYNSAEYMDHCIESILACGRDDIEVLIVDDGSAKDDTLAKAVMWQEKYPGICYALHQENGGHGAAVMKGLEHARGTYFKVVDSDDWLDNPSNLHMLAKLDEFVDDPLDLMVVNYVYEHVEDGKQEPMRYTKNLPQDRVFSWKEIGNFGISKYILMHSVIYRTQMLKDMHFDLPHHTFYVDNIFVYKPLPKCQRIYYLNVDLYRYFIGREDQSVNEKVMIGRIEQQLRITRIMIEAYHLYDEVTEPKLRAYMFNYLSMMMAICSIFSMMSDREDKDELRAGIWQHLKEFDPRMYQKIRGGFMGRFTNPQGKAGEKLTMTLYHIAQKIFKFN